MAALSRKLRSFTEGGDGPAKGFLHWCPGCEQAHAIYTSNRPGKPTWEWDGNVEAPTVTPSVLCFTRYDERDNLLPNNGQRTLCHYFLKAGKIEYCSDSPHRFAGQTVDLPDYR